MKMNEKKHCDSWRLKYETPDISELESLPLYSCDEPMATGALPTDQKPWDNPFKMINPLK